MDHLAKCDLDAEGEEDRASALVLSLFREADEQMLQEFVSDTLEKIAYINMPNGLFALRKLIKFLDAAEPVVLTLEIVTAGVLKYLNGLHAVIPTLEKRTPDGMVSFVDCIY